VQTVRQCEVDDPVITTKGYSRLGSVGRQWMQPRTHAAGKNDGHGFIEHLKHP
jgi:hypothetical protein